MTTEDEWSVPAQWRAKAEPFRGRNTVGAREIPADATGRLAALLGRYSPRVRSWLEVPPEGEFGAAVAAATGYIQAPDAPITPLAAAVVWALADYNLRHRESERIEMRDHFLDSWIQRHGPVFAAETVVWSRGIVVDRRRSSEGWLAAVLELAAPDDPNLIGFDYLAQSLRAHLASVPDDEYQAVVQRLSELREDPGTVWARLACTYLVPDQQEWLDTDLAADGRNPRSRARTMLSSCLTTEAQLDRFLEVTGPPVYSPDSQKFSMLTQVGPAAVPMILQQFDWAAGNNWTADIKTLSGMLSQVPTDAAYQALLNRIDNKHVAAALDKASARYPRRAMRLLSRQAAELATPLVVRTLRLHAAAHPDLIAEYAVAQALPLLEITKRLPDADTAALPPALTGAPPRKAPKPPKWLVPTLLPQLRLRETDTALPDIAAARFITMLIASGVDDDHPGVAEVIAAVEPAALAEFTWAIFDAWQLAAYPAKNGWVLHALALTGNDDTARRLVPYITAWPGKSGSARAVEGLRVLAAIGGEIALMHLHSIAGKTKYDSLRTEAEKQVAAIAERLGLGEEELADRVVPHLGLSADSTLRLNYGPREFEVGLDHELRPSISAGGRSLRSMPKPAAADDPELAPVAYQSFRDFAKELKTVTTDQLRRFEAAMVDGRRWRAPAQRAMIIEHPVLGQLARRLVWAIFAADGTVSGSFRVDQDGTLADIEDERLELPADALVGIAHPLHLGDDLTRWREVFTDYELLQPFEQLERPVYRFTPEEAAAKELPRFVDRKVPTGKLYGLRQRGWELGYSTLSHRFGVNRQVVVNVSPGIHGGYSYEAEEQLIVSVLCEGGEFGELDALTASELLRQLERLAA
ncbi:DUF4132 domain-containing protein [Nocardia sp. NPDC056000]|uniref:DUF4132 domain-containing protein n=1 Tax=Nocardia sp. NPDC056000 TaxID=3345674 RepID=UPI0035E329C8